MLENKLKEFEIIWRKHALHKMLEREISREHVIETINKGKVIQEYFDDKPFPSVLILYIGRKKPLHVVISLDNDNKVCYIITAYIPDLIHFESDYITRKRR